MHHTSSFSHLFSVSPRRQQKGAYAAYTYGPLGKRVKIILLDVRYHRSFDTDPLGEEQWAWLERALRQSDAQLHLIGSGIQILPHDKVLIEKWAQYPAARARLLRLLRDTCSSGLVLLSGDVHYAELSKIDVCASSCATLNDPSVHTSCDVSVSVPMVEVTSSGMTHAVGLQAPFGLGTWILNTLFRSSYQITGEKGGFFAELNFGTLEIHWDAEPRYVDVHVRDVNGTSRLHTKVEFPVTPKRNTSIRCVAALCSEVDMSSGASFLDLIRCCLFLSCRCCYWRCNNLDEVDPSLWNFYLWPFELYAYTYFTMRAVAIGSMVLAVLWIVQRLW